MYTYTEIHCLRLLYNAVSYFQSLLATTAETRTLSSIEIVLVGVIPGAVILLFGVISVVIAILVSKHCYNKNASQKISHRQPMHDAYDQVDLPKTYDEIPVTTNPAYGTSSAQEGKNIREPYDQVNIPKTYDEIPVTTNPAYGTSSAQEGKNITEPYDQVNIPKTYDEIPVTTNPAYGTSSAQEGKNIREPYDQVNIPKTYDEIPVTTNPAYGTSSLQEGKDYRVPYVDYI